MAYYFGARRPHRAGTVLVGRPPEHDDVESQATEAAFEKYRPEHVLSRLASVYMLDTPDPDVLEQAGAASADYVYEVAPLGRVVQNDVGWWPLMYDEASDRTAVAERSKKRIATAYFHGEPCGTGAHGVPCRWEYRAPAMRILRRVSARKEAGRRAHNPVSPHRFGMGDLQEVARRAARALGVRVGEVYGCGEMGCVAPVSGDPGHVLKVTTDALEVDAAREALRDGVYDGYARIDAAPIEVWRGRESPVWAYVREDVKPDVVDPGTPLAASLIGLLRASRQGDDGKYRLALRRLDAHAPGIAAYARRLERRGLLLGDTHRHNVGAREDGSLVVFDARLARASGAVRRPETTVLVDAEPPAKRRVTASTRGR